MTFWRGDEEPPSQRPPGCLRDAVLVMALIVTAWVVAWVLNSGGGR